MVHVYSPGQGQAAPRGHNFDVNINALSLYPFAASFKEISLKSEFIQFFHDIMHIYSPGAAADSPQGTSFDVNRKTLLLYPFVASFKKISLKSDFIQFFSRLIHVYGPGVGDIQPSGDKVLMSTETSCHFGHLLQVSNHRRQ